MCSFDQSYTKVSFLVNKSLAGSVSLQGDSCTTSSGFNTSMYMVQCINSTEYGMVIKQVHRQHHGDTWQCEGGAENTAVRSNCFTIQVKGKIRFTIQLLLQRTQLLSIIIVTIILIHAHMACPVYISLKYTTDFLKINKSLIRLEIYCNARNTYHPIRNRK